MPDGESARGEYEAERRLVIAEEGRRKDLRRSPQAELLPTVGQVERIMRNLGSAPTEPWDRALEMAALEPRATLHDQRLRRGRHPDSIPLVEAIHQYVEANGVPSKTKFAEFRKLADVKVETLRGRWNDALQAAIEYRAGLGFDGPTDLPPNGKPRAGESREVKAPKIVIPGAAPRELKGRSKYAEADCIDPACQYLEENEGPHNQKAYLLFAGRHGLPVPSYFQDQRRVARGATQGQGAGAAARWDVHRPPRQ